MSYKIHMKLDIDLTEERVSQIREEFLAALEAHSLKTEHFECKQGSLIIDLVIAGTVGGVAFVATKALEGFLAELGASIYRGLLRGLRDRIVSSPTDSSKSNLSPPVEMKNEEKMPVTITEEALKKRVTEMLRIDSISPRTESSFPCFEESLFASISLKDAILKGKGAAIDVISEGDETSEERYFGIAVKRVAASKCQITLFHNKSIIMELEK